MAGASALRISPLRVRRPDAALLVLAVAILAFTALDGGRRVLDLRRSKITDAADAPQRVAPPSFPPAVADLPLAVGLFGIAAPRSQAGADAPPNETVASLGLKVVGLAYAESGAPSRAVIVDRTGQITVVGTGATLGAGLTVRSIGPDSVLLDTGGARASLAFEVRRAVARSGLTAGASSEQLDAPTPDPETPQPAAAPSAREQARALRERLYGHAGR